MTYSQQLYPWCIIRVFANEQLRNTSDVQQSNVVARFHRRNDAVAYLQVLPSSSKNIKYLIIFDVSGRST